MNKVSALLYQPGVARLAFATQGKGPSEGSPPCWGLSIPQVTEKQRSLLLKNLQNDILLLKPHCLWQFVTAALGNEGDREQRACCPKCIEAYTLAPAFEKRKSFIETGDRRHGSNLCPQ